MARPLSWLVVAGLASAALIGPGAGGVAATGGPGSPDFVPNSGHTSSSGLTLTMGTATMSCTQGSVNSFSGSFEFSGTGHVVVYAAANGGSDASPAENVQDNEATIDVTGSGTATYTITITSPFTATSGGVLVVFASDVANTNTYSSKSNSLNCTETTTTTSSSTTETSTTVTSTTETSTTETSTTDTSTTDTSTTDTSTTDTSTTDTSTTDTSTTETSSETTQTSTGSESGTESSTTTTSSSTGEELGATGTPGQTPPTTDTIGVASAPASADGFRFVLLGLAFLIAMILLLQPKDVATRK
jgi:hypothetical protein